MSITTQYDVEVPGVQNVPFTSDEAVSISLIRWQKPQSGTHVASAAVAYEKHGFIVRGSMIGVLTHRQGQWFVEAEFMSCGRVEHPEPFKSWLVARNFLLGEFLTTVLVNDVRRWLR